MKQLGYVEVVILIHVNMVIVQKKSLIEKEFVFSKETLSTFAQLIETKAFNILGIGSLKANELVDIAKQLGLEKIADKSNEMLRKEVNHLSKLFLAGQVMEAFITKTSKKVGNHPNLSRHPPLQLGIFQKVGIFFLF